MSALARNIVNQLFDEADVPVERRQAINDRCDQFVDELIAREMVDALVEQAVTNVDDLRLVVLSAVAFNLGFTQRRDIEPADTERLWDACERLGAVAGLEVGRTRGAA